MSLDCPLLIAPSVFSNAYLPVSLDCPFLIAPSVFSNDYLPVSPDCPFLIALRFSLTFILPVSLDCPLLIAPSVFFDVYLPVSLDCSFLIALRFSLTLICQCLWIVHYWMHLPFSLTFIFNLPGLQVYKIYLLFVKKFSIDRVSVFYCFIFQQTFIDNDQCFGLALVYINYWHLQLLLLKLKSPSDRDKLRRVVYPVCTWWRLFQWFGCTWWRLFQWFGWRWRLF